MASEAGKGSVRRPTQISQEQADANWERIFGKKNTVNQRGLTQCTTPIDEMGFIETNDSSDVK